MFYHVINLVPCDFTKILVFLQKASFDNFGERSTEKTENIACR